MARIQVRMAIGAMKGSKPIFATSLGKAVALHLTWAQDFGSGAKPPGPGEVGFTDTFFIIFLATSQGNAFPRVAIERMVMVLLQKL